MTGAGDHDLRRSIGSGPGIHCGGDVSRAIVVTPDEQQRNGRSVRGVWLHELSDGTPDRNELALLMATNARSASRRAGSVTAEALAMIRPKLEAGMRRSKGAADFSSQPSSAVSGPVFHVESITTRPAYAAGLARTSVCAMLPPSEWPTSTGMSSFR